MLWYMSIALGLLSGVCSSVQGAARTKSRETIGQRIHRQQNELRSICIELARIDGAMSRSAVVLNSCADDKVKKEHAHLITADLEKQRKLLEKHDKIRKSMTKNQEKVRKNIAQGSYACGAAALVVAVVLSRCAISSAGSTETKDPSPVVKKAPRSVISDLYGPLSLRTNWVVSDYLSAQIAAGLVSK